MKRSFSVVGKDGSACQLQQRHHYRSLSVTISSFQCCGRRALPMLLASYFRLGSDGSVRRYLFNGALTIASVSRRVDEGNSNARYATPSLTEAGVPCPEGKCAKRLVSERTSERVAAGSSFRREPCRRKHGAFCLSFWRTHSAAIFTSSPGSGVCWRIARIFRTNPNKGLDGECGPKGDVKACAQGDFCFCLLVVFCHADINSSDRFAHRMSRVTAGKCLPW